MRLNDVVQIYLKEREYEKEVFGDYENLPELSFPSFLIFLKQYVDKAIEAYTGKWDNKLPPWLKGCAEMKNYDGTGLGSAPVKAYEEVIKIMALSGAALETYTNIDASKWRENPEADAQKWKND